MFAINKRLHSLLSGDFFCCFLVMCLWQCFLKSAEIMGEKSRGGDMCNKVTKLPKVVVKWRKVMWETSLSKHKRTHTGEKKNCCSICYKAFARTDTLQRHTQGKYSDLEKSNCCHAMANDIYM